MVQLDKFFVNVKIGRYKKKDTKADMKSEKNVLTTKNFKEEDNLSSINVCYLGHFL